MCWSCSCFILRIYSVQIDYDFWWWSNLSLVWKGIYCDGCVCRGKLRQIMYRCLHQAMYVLGAPAGMVGRLVPVVVDILVCVHNKSSLHSIDWFNYCFISLMHSVLLAGRYRISYVIGRIVVFFCIFFWYVSFYLHMCRPMYICTGFRTCICLAFYAVILLINIFDLMFETYLRITTFLSSFRALMSFVVVKVSKQWLAKVYCSILG